MYFSKGQVDHDYSKGKNYNNYRYQDEFDKYIMKNLGITYNHLIGEERVFHRAMMNIWFYKEMEMRITAYHRNVMGFVFPE